MAKIPRILPTGNQLAKINTPSPVRRINRDEMTTEGEIMTITGRGIEEVGNMLESALLTGEKIKAQNYLDIQLSTIENEASLDTSLSKEKQKEYDDRVNKATSEAARMIKIPAASALFGAEAQSKAEISRLRIKNDYTKKVIDNNKAAMEERESILKKKYIKSYSPQDSETAKLEFNPMLEDGITGGYLTREEAMKKKLNMEKDWDQGRLDYDISRDESTSTEDSFVYNQLQLGSKGFYANVDPEVRAKSIDNIQIKIGRNKRLAEYEIAKDQDKNEAEMLVAWADGALTEDYVKESLLSNRVRLRFGEKMLKNIYSDRTTETDIGFYAKVRELQSSGSSPEEINKLIIDNPDKLSDSDKKLLVNKTFTEKDRIRNEKLRYNASALRVWEKRNAVTSDEETLESSSMSYDFFQRVDKENAQGKRIDEIADEVLRDNIKRNYPETALMKDVPNFVADRNRIRKTYEKESKLKGQKAKLGTLTKSGPNKEKLLMGYDAKGNPIYDELEYGDNE